MKLEITVKYFLKSLVPSCIILGVFYFGWKDNPDNTRMTYAFIGCVVSAFLFPFSMQIIKKTAFTFITSAKIWQTDFFTNPVGGSLVAIFELFCFVVSIPVCIIYFLFLLVKALSNK